MSILHERVHLDTTDHDDSRVPFTHFNSFARSRSSLLFDTARSPLSRSPCVDERHRAPRKRMRADEGV